MLRLLAAFLGFSLVNPLCMASSFWFCMRMDVYRPTSTNVVTFDMPFLPVYLAIGMLVLLVQFLLVYGIALIAYHGRRVAVAKVARAFLSAQKPFLLLVLALPVVMGDVEGNVLVFGVIYAFPFVVVAAVFAALSLFKKLKAAVDEPSDKSGAFMVGAGGAVAIAVCASLVVIWTRGPVNGFGEWLAWRSDTPQYAIRRVAEGLQAGDVAKLEAYVDLDTILGQLAVIGGPSRADLAEALANRQRRGETHEGIRYKEWSVGADADGDNRALRLVLPREQDARFAATIDVQSKVTGESFALNLAMQPISGRYRITRVDNLEDIAEDLAKWQEKARRMPALADEAKAKAQSLANVRLRSMRENHKTLRCEFDVVNTGVETIRLLECAVVLRRVDSGAVALTEAVSLDFDPAGLSAGHATRVEASLDVSPVVARNVQTGRLIAADVVPVAIVCSDKRVDLVQLAD